MKAIHGSAYQLLVHDLPARPMPRARLTYRSLLVQPLYTSTYFPDLALCFLESMSGVTVSSQIDNGGDP
jgi:hypothetical protein